MVAEKPLQRQSEMTIIFQISHCWIEKPLWYFLFYYSQIIYHNTTLHAPLKRPQSDYEAYPIKPHVLTPENGSGSL